MKPIGDSNMGMKFSRSFWPWRCGNFKGRFVFFEIITRNTIFAAATREARELGETLRLENRREKDFSTRNNNKKTT